MCLKIVSGLVILFFSTISSATGLPDLRLVEAVKEQNSKAIRALLNEKNPNVNAAQGDGTTALAWAVYWEDLETARLLINAGADVNTTNDIGVSPLILACDNRNASMVKLLLDAGAEPNKSLWSGVTPLMTATAAGVVEVVNLLLEHGADINTKDPRRNQTALMWAISFGYQDIAKTLIEHGADINSKSTELKEKEELHPMLLEGYAANVKGIALGGYTPLMFAARSGDLATARLLVNKGANINDVSVEDGSALVIASAYGYEELALFLLEHGAHPAQADANGMTAMHYAMRDGLKSLHGYQLEPVTQVCGFGTPSPCKPLENLTNEEQERLNDPDSGLAIVKAELESDKNGVLPGNNMYRLTEALLARGVDPDMAMNYPPPRLRLARLPWLSLAGATPFLLATASMDISAMEMLLEYGANPLVTTHINENTFHKQLEIHADDNQIYGNGTTLMVAVGLGKQKDFTSLEEKKALQAAKRLVALGADVNAATATGWTSLHAAAFLGANSLINFLVDNGARVNVQNGCGQTPLSLAEGKNVAGLIIRARPHESTVKLLKDRGASSSPQSSAPVGKCVLGRGGLEIDIEIRKEVREFKQQVQQDKP